MLCHRVKTAAHSAADLVRLRAVSCTLLLAAGCWLGSPLAFAQARQPQAASAAKPDPEALLLEVYKDLGANRLREAQAKADALVEAYPTFRLGQLIRGDLLQLHTRPISTLGAAPNAPEDKLKNLRDEARARLKWLREKPDRNLVPRFVLQLRDDQKQVLVVDAKRSRLYVYENQRGRLKFNTDYYISQGKLGINKLKEGDQRTPIGVYYITQRVPGNKLPDFYGTGALPINYPNEWDKLNGRSGSGIWLHGVPSDSYSRPPLSSDGCVVLTNTDLNELYQTVEAGKTPVVIADRVEFVTRSKLESERNLANRLITEWRRDFESLDVARVMANYSRQYKSERGENLQALSAKYQKILKGVKKISMQIEDSTFFLYPGRDDLIVSTFTQETTVGKMRSSARKRQYWAREGGQWKIISETNL
ncbi:murein L,D-transpeptidase YafK [Paucimonas lemoignei]|uniref:Murein L,D-transpeptidase YafK n=1 Tax=Paucimonas lemoignei TaxID=29443 RepID=A0A4R3HZA1_PAULE|nr:L,D-transpeptidase family protein [Paucimonas lemoignei]TCS38696.1 murein L,D-transpeptidase YafK [Paucimonas lemoignei]